MREAVLAMLRALGVSGADGDPLLDMAIESARQRIKNLTNLREVPEGLRGVAVSMAAGEYLRMKKGAGQLEDFDLGMAVKQIQEGDTSVSFAVGGGSSTPEQRLDNLIGTLINARMDEIYRYRRIAW